MKVTKTIEILYDLDSTITLEELIDRMKNLVNSGLGRREKDHDSIETSCGDRVASTLSLLVPKESMKSQIKELNLYLVTVLIARFLECYLKENSPTIVKFEHFGFVGIALMRLSINMENVDIESHFRNAMESLVWLGAGNDRINAAQNKLFEAREPIMMSTSVDYPSNVQLGTGQYSTDETWPYIACNLHENPLLSDKYGPSLVAVIGTGICGRNRAFIGQLADVNKYYLRCNTLNIYCSKGAWNYPEDFNGHGTMVASIVAAKEQLLAYERAIGVETNCQLLPIKVSNGLFVSSDDLIRGLSIALGEVPFTEEYLSRNVHEKYSRRRADVILLTCTAIGGDIQFNTSLALERMITHAVGCGIAVVVAAGNDPRAKSVPFPGSIHGTISVGSISVDEEMSSGHDIAIRVSKFSNSSPEVTVYAPGEGVMTLVPMMKRISAENGFKYVSGTSFAAPFVAGMFAGRIKGIPIDNNIAIDLLSRDEMVSTARSKNKKIRILDGTRTRSIHARSGGNQ